MMVRLRDPLQKAGLATDEYKVWEALAIILLGFPPLLASDP